MQTLKNISYFSNLPPHELQKINTFSSRQKFSTNEILFYEGESPKYLYILLTGTLKVYQTTAKANQVFILFLNKPGEIIGEFALYANSTYPNTAQFITEGEVLKIDFFPVQKEMFNNPLLNLYVIQSLIKKQRIFLNVIQKELSTNTETKIAQFLLENELFLSTLKRIEIASILNTTPETLSRMLSKFKSLGFIHSDKHHSITLVNKEALSAYYHTLLQH
ncbi:MAG: Crp/Fnr family transcriptional regulator [Sulfurospirillaceae bacterium]|jgi:CRP/FNR family transcriptional regulator|nr:Crp/Fnr family transcriptional regulator [Sulfurospirillaceae bacterium]MDD2827738.1 Crp/Fnr family transcriptional regulator [Sulfurospirillaceae bacterium]